MSSAGWKNITYRQDLPPPGGYGAVPYKRNLPLRGPSGITIWGLVFATHGAAYWLHEKKIKWHHMVVSENKQAELCLEPLLDAEKDRAMLRYWKQTVESEALNIVGTGYDPDYKPGTGDVFETDRYHDPVREFKNFWGINLLTKIKSWYESTRVARCGP